MATSIVINCQDGTEVIETISASPSAGIPLPAPILNVVDGNIVFSMPVVASDFFVQTPDVHDDPTTALVEAAKEARKGKGVSKSLAYIALSLVNYVEDAEKRLKRAKV